nr:thioredoxin domain-containing protein 9 like [Quercus suber]
MEDGDGETKGVENKPEGLAMNTVGVGVAQIIEKQVLTVAKAMEDKLDEEISALDRLDLDDLEVLKERRLQQMKKMADKRSR